MNDQPTCTRMKAIRIAAAGLLAGTLIATVLTASRASAEDVHVVEPGDTAWTIAVRYGISLADLVEINGLVTPEWIYPGETLVVSGGDQAIQQPGAGPASGSHTIAPGETLSGIASRYGVILADLATTNGIVNLDRIIAGQVLTIPGGGASTVAYAASVRPAYVSKDEAQAALRAAADEFGIPVSLMLALSYQESGFQQHVMSRAGAVGLMQVMPETGEWAAEFLIGGNPDWRNSALDNARVGASVMRHLLILADWDIDLALSGYYQGWGATVAYGPFDETWQYIANIRHFMAMFE